jgi:hypothetical protein
MKKVLIVVAGLIVALLAGSQLIPAEWKVGRSTVIAAKPQAIYPLVADWKNWEQWSAFKTPSMTFTYSGKASGLGAICLAKDGKMEVHNEIVAADPAKGITYKCTVAGWDPCDCTIAFTPEGTGTKVDFSYAGRYGRNPLHRLMGLVLNPTMGKPLQGGLDNLKRLVEAKGATPKGKTGR